MPIDADPERPGLQPIIESRYVESTPDGERVYVLDPCDGANTPCFRLEETNRCGSGSRHMLKLERDGLGAGRARSDIVVEAP
jgi:hypothetical protein